MAKTRRGNTEGSVYQRSSDGRWVGALTVGGGKRAYVYARTRAEANRKLVRRQRELDGGRPAADERARVGPYLERWLHEVVRNSTRQRTYETYESHVRLYLKPTLGHIRLARLQPADVQNMISGLLARGLSPATVNRARATLRNALGQAERWGLVSRNVAGKLVTPPKETRFRALPPTAEQARTLLNATVGDRLHCLWLISLTCGLRPGEALALRWRDIDLQGGTVRVEHTLHRLKGGGWSLGPVKAERAARTLQLPQLVVDGLREHETLQQRERVSLATQWTDNGFVFASESGTPLDAPNVLKRLHRALEGAGLPKFRFQDLRHACATYLIAQGASPRLVMDTLGHSTFRLTMDTYAHILPTLQQDAALKMDAFFRTPSEPP